METKKLASMAHAYYIPIAPHCASGPALTAANIHVDLSFVERLDTVAALLAEVPARQVLFGSHTPFLYTRAAVMKLRTAAVGRRELRAIAKSRFAGSREPVASWGTHTR